jgi:hypothetical protein
MKELKYVSAIYIPKVCYKRFIFTRVCLQKGKLRINRETKIKHNGVRSQYLSTILV